jgi:hypothetical protein
MTLFQRWKQTALHNKALVLTGFIVALGTLFGTGAAILQVCMMRENNRKTSEQIAKLIDAANTQTFAAQKIANASDKNAAAAEKFSASADNIREETTHAVLELRRAANDSETAMKDNSRNGQNALNTSIEADLPPIFSPGIM